MDIHKWNDVLLHYSVEIDFYLFMIDLMALLVLVIQGS
jgi:hypothetical protein